MVDFLLNFLCEHVMFFFSNFSFEHAILLSKCKKVELELQILINTTFNSISEISWRIVLIFDKTGVP